MSNLTCMDRFTGSTDLNLTSLCEAIPLSGCVPNLDTNHYHYSPPESVTLELFNRRAMMTYVDNFLYPSDSLASAFILRGNISTNEFLRSINRMDSNIAQCIDSSAIVRCNVPPSGFAQSALLLSNETGIVDVFMRFMFAMRTLLRNRAHLWSFVNEGMHEDFFQEVIDSCEDLVSQYRAAADIDDDNIYGDPDRTIVPEPGMNSSQ
ncbi:hypothetical protein ACOME3_000544 [Neoechinorhynchus agilis]